MQFAIIEKITTIRKEGEIDGPESQLNINKEPYLNTNIEIYLQNIVLPYSHT